PAVSLYGEVVESLLLGSPSLPPLSPYTTLFRSCRLPEARPHAEPLEIPDASEHRAQLAPQPRVHHEQLDLIETAADALDVQKRRDRKSTRLNSSHVKISYAVFCLKKKFELTIYD